MTNERLAPSIEVSALLALAAKEGGFGTVLQKGDGDRGSIIVLVEQRGQPAAVLQRLLQRTGAYEWESREFSDSVQLQQYVARARDNDPDLWAIELDVPSPERLIAEIRHSY